MVEYLIVVGLVSLVAIAGFYRYGREVHSHLKVEARHIEGKGMPDAVDLLDMLGGAVPQPDEIFQEVLTGDGLDVPTGTGLDSLIPSGVEATESGNSATGSSTGSGASQPSPPTDTGTTPTPVSEGETGTGTTPSPVPEGETGTGSASPPAPSPPAPSPPSTSAGDSVNDRK
jgi:hypothetical protein